jgi:predicted SAM-dependent methyltransferase
MQLNVINSFVSRMVPAFLKRKWLNKKIMNSEGLKIVVGAGNTIYENWISTDYPVFDILNSDHWHHLFGTNKIDNILAEHVYEHLTPEQLMLSLYHLRKYASHNIVVRIAVPDGNFPSINYLNHVKPGGIGPGAKDHKVLYTKEIIEVMFEGNSEWKLELVEYWAPDGNFFSTYNPVPNGRVQRSRNEDWRNKGPEINYTSLIFDITRRV